MLKVVLMLCGVLGGVWGEEVGVGDGVKVTDATRDVDMSTQLVVETVKLELENGGKSPLHHFLFAVSQADAKLLSYITATSKGKNLKVTKLSAVKGLKSEDAFFKIDLAEGVNAGGNVKVDVESTFTHKLQPHPIYITQAENQFVVYEGNAHILSPYTVVKQKTKLKLAPGSLEAHTKVQPTKHEGDTITYGPYENVPPFSNKEVAIHFENNSPFLTVTHLERVLEISSWGNIAIEETLEIVHTGAKLKGSFSRFDFQRDRRERMPVVQSFKTVLPAAAKDVYYRDEIGNISTSNLRRMDDMVEMEIRPRFPLFGGWKTNYYIGYNLPSYQYLFVSGNKYALKTRLVDHIYDRFVVDKMTLKIILPEGAKDLKLKAPYKVELGEDQTHYTYLDVEGRPVKIARKSNLVEKHIQDFELHYTFDRMSMIREPLMIIVSFYLLFLVVIVWVRLDFTISKDAQSEARLKAAGLVEQIHDLHADRVSHYEAWTDAVATFKNNKDNTTLNASRKKVDANLKQVTQSIADVQTQLKTENPDLAEKINEVQRLDRSAREHLVSLAQGTERLVVGKMQKAAHNELEKSTRNKLDDLREKMEAIIFSL